MSTELVQSEKSMWPVKILQYQSIMRSVPQGPIVTSVGDICTIFLVNYKKKDYSAKGKNSASGNMG